MHVVEDSATMEVERAKDHISTARTEHAQSQTRFAALKSAIAKLHSNVRFLAVFGAVDRSRQIENLKPKLTEAREMVGASTAGQKLKRACVVSCAMDLKASTGFFLSLLVVLLAFLIYQAFYG
jgi:hypothetical protein